MLLFISIDYDRVPVRFPCLQISGRFPPIELSAHDNKSFDNVGPITSSDVPIVLQKHKFIYAEEFNCPPELLGHYVSNGIDEFISLEKECYGSNRKRYHPENRERTRMGWMCGNIPSNDATGRLCFMLVAPAFRPCRLYGGGYSKLH